MSLYLYIVLYVIRRERRLGEQKPPYERPPVVSGHLVGV